MGTRMPSAHRSIPIGLSDLELKKVQKTNFDSEEIFFSKFKKKRWTVKVFFQNRKTQCRQQLENLRARPRLTWLTRAVWCEDEEWNVSLVSCFAPARFNLFFVDSIAPWCTCTLIHWHLDPLAPWSTRTLEHLTHIIAHHKEVSNQIFILKFYSTEKEALMSCNSL